VSATEEDRLTELTKKYAARFVVVVVFRSGAYAPPAKYIHLGKPHDKPTFVSNSDPTKQQQLARWVLKDTKMFVMKQMHTERTGYKSTIM
jgi:hypothetical protein